MKRIFLALLCIGAVSAGFSQDDYDDEDDYVKEAYGVRACANLSGLAFGDSPKIFANENNVGFAFGFFSEIELSNNDKFYFAPELQFSAEGAKETKLRMDYLKLVLPVKFKFKELFAVVGGPVVGVKVNRYSDDLKKGNSYSITTLRENDFNYFSAAAMLGGEVTFFDPFFVDIRYYYGITDVFSKSSLLGARNNTIQLGVGLKF